VLNEQSEVIVKTRTTISQAMWWFDDKRRRECGSHCQNFHTNSSGKVITSHEELITRGCGGEDDRKRGTTWLLCRCSTMTLMHTQEDS